MTTLTVPIINFFAVEVRNEDDGGVSPATLASAFDSFVQAPDDVLSDWCEIDVTGPVRAWLQAELVALIAEHGDDCTLDGFDTGPSGIAS